jgi:hypothetical protein
MRLSNWRRRFNQARDTAGLDPRLTPHGLRHTDYIEKRNAYLVAAGLPKPA